jgi:hypothetical protein
MKKTGLGRGKPIEPFPPDPPEEVKTPKPRPERSQTPLIVAGFIAASVGATSAYAFFNSPSIEVICTQIGNCQRYKDTSDQAEKSLELATKKLNSINSLQDLNDAKQLIDTAKKDLASVPDNAQNLTTPISKQRAKAEELDKSIAVKLKLEQETLKSIQSAKDKIGQADKLNRNPQGDNETAAAARQRLEKPKALYIESQVLLKTISPDSLFIKDSQSNFAIASARITDIDSKLAAVKELDPCVINPNACIPPEPVDPCVADPASCYSPPPPPPRRRGPILFGPGSY